MAEQTWYKVFLFEGSGYEPPEPMSVIRQTPSKVVFRTREGAERMEKKQTRAKPPTPSGCGRLANSSVWS
jgi:hypothetical protein